ncbi:hypothetical protein BG90_5157 [Burkholderia oklahomensis C6786]|nr:hypothetical protein BG90_5157 [Burkholderia oklahomensis C6786]
MSVGARERGRCGPAANIARVRRNARFRFRHTTVMSVVTLMTIM